MTTFTTLNTQDTVTLLEEKTNRNIIKEYLEQCEEGIGYFFRSIDKFIIFGKHKGKDLWNISGY